MFSTTYFPSPIFSYDDGQCRLTWSQKRIDSSFLPGTHVVFFVLNIVEAFGLLMMFKPFLGEKKKPDQLQ
ncbi:hypothetical protein VIGAN_06059100 [Vigna angularis var. angularis]|uniref:Uncharacterized protein n=1 Tax=Vigna angularis var. angularis TaxID=157739 RepID=A0A0S3S9Q4_PHAAN|nr:hypothetical protein VIGAN_06059100 [Vigna angularis var. angularis]